MCPLPLQFDKLVGTLVKPTLDLRECKGARAPEEDEEGGEGGEEEVEFLDMHLEARPHPPPGKRGTRAWTTRRE